MLSTLRIISAASAEDFSTCLLTWKDSVIPISTISAITPLFMSVNINTELLQIGGFHVLMVFSGRFLMIYKTIQHFVGFGVQSDNNCNE